MSTIRLISSSILIKPMCMITRGWKPSTSSLRNTGQQGKKLHLLNLSDECRKLLRKAEHIVEVTIIEGAHYQLADDQLAWQGLRLKERLKRAKATL